LFRFGTDEFIVCWNQEEGKEKAMKCDEFM
jgi:hypothetical protein